MNYIGCSGFMYEHWKGVFYPDSLSKGKWFSHYMTRFNTVELNVTFYRLPREETFKKWKDNTPDDFAFSLKGSRFITHVRRLDDVGDAVTRFFQSASHLREKLHVILWQFPPQFALDTGRLEKFIRLLRPFGKRNVFEFRNESWLQPDVEEMLRDNGFGYCMADWPEFLKELPVVSDYVYIRRHGRKGRYNTLYTEQELRKDSRFISSLRKRGVMDVYVYFNNDYRGYAPRNAETLKEMLG
jgi:uncharacterized protein YecE (DUF72 family)